MSDAVLLWSDDLASGATGDLAVISGEELGQQRVLRRLMTNPGDYLWHQDYGAGLGAYVGSPADVQAIRARIRSQIFLEAAVAQTPAPTIDVQSGTDGTIFVEILYLDVPSGAGQILAFSVSA